MKAVECLGLVRPDGNVEISRHALAELTLMPETQVKVLVLQPETAAVCNAKIDAESGLSRNEAISALLKLREQFSGMNFDLTDEVIRMREEEDG